MYNSTYNSDFIILTFKHLVYHKMCDYNTLKNNQGYEDFDVKQLVNK